MQLLADNHRWCNQTVGKECPLPHLFKDILELNDANAKRVAGVGGYLDQKERFLRLPLRATQTCLWHTASDGGPCDCEVPGADFGCSGLPCTDMSKAGKRLKREGPSNTIYITHSKYVEAKRVPLFVIECTPVP